MSVLVRFLGRWRVNYLGYLGIILMILGFYADVISIAHSRHSFKDEKMEERKSLLDQQEKNRSERRRTEDYIDFLRGKDIKENRDFIAFLRGKKPKEKK